MAGTTLATLPHMAVVAPDTSYAGHPRPRMGIDSSTSYSTKALSPGHQRVRQGIVTSNRLALWPTTDSRGMQSRRVRENSARASRRSSAPISVAPGAQFSNKPWVISP